MAWVDRRWMQRKKRAAERPPKKRRRDQISESTLTFRHDQFLSVIPRRLAPVAVPAVVPEALLEGVPTPIPPVGAMHAGPVEHDRLLDVAERHRTGIAGQRAGGQN